MRLTGCILIFTFLYSDGQRLSNCVIPSLCNDMPDIDPRITTPDETTTPSSSDNCPSGYISCLDVKCGVSTIQPDATDGIATRGAFPWHVFLQDANKIAVKSGYAGGGVLIDQYYVLTAAHKVANLTNVNVLLGVYNSSDLPNTQISKVSAMYIHSGYDQVTLKNDVALLLLETPINFDENINKICLPKAAKSYQNTSTGCVVSGFGQTNFFSDDAPTVVMKQVHVPIVDTQACRASFLNPALLGSNTDVYLDLQNEICAGGQEGRDACTQDGGSPLTCLDTATKANVLAGLVLWGKNCGQPNVYGVYLNVPSYIPWVECTQLCMLGLISCSTCPATTN